MPAEPLPPGKGGKPPYDHPRRCQAIRRCGLRCERWALTGTINCQFHGGRKRGKGQYWIQAVSRFYKRSLTASLQAVIAEQMEMKPDDQLQLFEELALVREQASNHVKIYSAALESGKQDMIMAAGELMAISMQQVAEMCKSAAAVSNSQKEKFTAHDISYIVEQIIRISYDCFKDDERVNEFAMMIRTQLQLREKDRGTTITPDQDVLEMDRLTLGDSE
jgi:hypothetical protein